MKAGTASSLNILSCLNLTSGRHRHADHFELLNFRHFSLSFAHRIMQFVVSLILFNFQYSQIGSHGNPSVSEMGVSLSPKCTPGLQLSAPAYVTTNNPVRIRLAVFN